MTVHHQTPRWSAHTQACSPQRTTHPRGLSPCLESGNAAQAPFWDLPRAAQTLRSIRVCAAHSCVAALIVLSLFTQLHTIYTSSTICEMLPAGKDSVWHISAGTSYITCTWQKLKSWLVNKSSLKKWTAYFHMTNTGDLRDTEGCSRPQQWSTRHSEATHLNTVLSQCIIKDWNAYGILQARILE